MRLRSKGTFTKVVFELDGFDLGIKKEKIRFLQGGSTKDENTHPHTHILSNGEKGLRICVH